MNETTVPFGSVTVGDVPRIVGIVSSFAHADALLAGERPPCDLIEMRLDRIGVETDDWIECGKTIEAKGLPVIATLRLQDEGGDWTGPDEARHAAFMHALKHLSAVDIELRSGLLPELAEEADRRGRGLIVSFHDFEKTPPDEELEDVIRRASVNGRSVVKIACRVNTGDDSTRLKQLLSRERTHPLCLIGMGELGIPTRVDFPKQGSCLAYGHLGESTAPGQLPLEEIARRLRA